jgi:hypothetical protein
LLLTSHSNWPFIGVRMTGYQHLCNNFDIHSSNYTRLLSIPTETVQDLHSRPVRYCFGTGLCRGYGLTSRWNQPYIGVRMTGYQHLCNNFDIHSSNYTRLLSLPTEIVLDLHSRAVRYCYETVQWRY